ncbi:MAG: hypothetical protein ABI895_11545 [Deltaproteobacteria bacterium]
MSAQTDASARTPSGFYLRIANGFAAYDERLNARDGALGGRNREVLVLY